MSPSLQGPGSQNNPDGFSGDLAALLRSLSQRISNLERGAPLRTAGIHIAPEGMTIDSGLHVTGDTVIDGTLSLPAGIIGNDALANPVSLDSQAQASTNMAFTTTPTVYSTFTFTVPAGFTNATVFITGSGRCLNTTASTIYFFAQSRVDTSGGAWVQGNTQQVALLAGYQGTVGPTVTGTLAVVGGQTVTVSIFGYTGAATTAYSGNMIGFDGVVFYTR